MTASADVADLHALLPAADISRPVVLVGHSYGGLIAVLEAVEHSDEVAGVLLIDASHPDQYERWDALMTEDQRQQLRSNLAQFPFVDFESSLEEVAAEYRAFPPLPLTVISSSEVDQSACDDGLPCVAMRSAWMDLQDDYASLSPDARHVHAPTGHYIQDEDPDLVVDEILRMLDRIGTTPHAQPNTSSP